jgi:prevent-host-death family protein
LVEIDVRTVSAREANQGFSKLLQAVVEGEEVVITRRGKPVARLARIEDTARDAERQAEIDQIIAHLREGIDLGEPVSWTRDELYER